MMAKTHAPAGLLFVAAGAPVASEAFGLGFTPGELAAGLGIGTIAGLLPDIDHPDSVLTKGKIPIFNKLGVIGRVAVTALSIPPRVVGVGARAAMGHRGGTHSILFMIGWSVLAAPLYAAFIALAALVASVVLGALSAAVFDPLLGKTVAFSPGAVVDWLIAHTPSVMPLVVTCVFLGYLSHLFTDSLTSAPVPWPWPLKRRRGKKKGDYVRWFFLPPGLRIKTDSVAEKRLVRPIIVVLAVAFSLSNVAIPLGQQIVEEGRGQAEKIERKLDGGKKDRDTKRKAPRNIDL